jgi:hypothetical protein
MAAFAQANVAPTRRGLLRRLRLLPHAGVFFCFFWFREQNSIDLIDPHTPLAKLSRETLSRRLHVLSL